MIQGVNKLMQPTALDGVKALQAPDVKSVGGPSFSEVLSQAIESVNNQQNHADVLTEALASGQAPDLHTVMIAAEKASISFQLMVQIRNKAMEAYQEVMRMQV
ncbi:flagellar hook-basal body complex protein FliE [Tumebacillus algifaecis]|uniref:Flagellar hook-basal body complex protein FliE n=1 Tax=Tumebacillus algifaecis TaxID=1214604 RepID=A0A223D2I4_9BACL|nr:flagellar hook-basal body complex protein FliE [Tumebacillus algifaecis]ASS75653.1 flagellar hook-basal body complex protein FliE [Tumebacillus algifaecis]